MKLLNIKTGIITLCFTIFFSTGLFALEFEQQNSSLSYLSVKKNTVAEVGYFRDFSVSVAKSGHFTLSVELASIDSGIEVRDHRLSTFLFEVIRFPKANITGYIDPAYYKDLQPGQYVNKQLNVNLNLHGVQKKIQANVKIIALADGSLNVSTNQAILLNTADFRLTKGIKKLAELAKLDAINMVVPVSFNLNFKR